MSAQIFHVVPDRNTRGNHLLAIGSDGYNKVRYPGNRYSGIPLWISKLRSDLRRKEEGNFKSVKTNAGTISSPAAFGLRQDVKNCIYLNLHFKSKTFEYNATTYEFKVHGKYVATLDPNTGVIGAFSIQHINDKYSRYRLRDLGIRLISKDGKTFWKFGVEKSYYEYLLCIHGSLKNMREFFKPLFPSIKVEQKEPEEDTNDFVIVFTCELKDNIKYPVRPPGGFHSLYGRNDKYSYGSGIFHNYTTEPDSISMVEIRSQAHESTNRFTKELNNLTDVTDREQLRYQLELLLKVGFKNFAMLLRFSQSGKSIEYNTYGCDLSLDPSLKYVYLKNSKGDFEFSFEELDIGENFKLQGLSFTPRSKWEVIEIADYCCEFQGVKIHVETEEGIFPLKFSEKFFRNSAVLEKLVGKELLIR